MEKSGTNEELIYSLIIDDLEQTISDADKQLLEEWRRTAEINEKFYQDFADVQLNIEKLYHKNGFDPQLSWNTLNNKLELQADVELLEEPKHKSSISLWFKVAAAVLVIVSVGYYFMLGSKYVVVSTTQSDVVSRVILPDGTELSLNAGTIIKYDKENFNADRKLVLERGEVFIQVSKHKGSQFRIDLGDVEARDIGTSFNVVKNEAQASVIVEEGKVAMKHRIAGEQVLLTPGMLGVYNTETKQLSRMNNTDPNYKAWVDKKFIFHEMPFEQVAAQLKKVYKMPLIIKGDDLKSRKLTAKLHYQTLDSVLEVISASLQCKLVKEQNVYVLSAN
ncbi:MAG TPA: FecR domain-containing protein [Pedobacter sp.]|uniref:FecR family protein n=1 Tax=Pedobacter sp. TaxID=1411316 RepID=UPI002C927131|nr:FecR domain-containing protein [Pedobacter sp.]HMI05100.1 FecR domain-containing protein [Pedobacter sp.]